MIYVIYTTATGKIVRTGQGTLAFIQASTGVGEDYILDVEASDTTHYVDITGTPTVTIFPAKPSEFHIWNYTTSLWDEVLPNPSYTNVVVVTNIKYLELSFDITDANWPEYQFETEIHISDDNNIANAVLTATIIGNNYIQILSETKNRYIWLRPKWESSVGSFSSMITVSANEVVTSDIQENAVSTTTLITNPASLLIDSYDTEVILLSA